MSEQKTLGSHAHVVQRLNLTPEPAPSDEGEGVELATFKRDGEGVKLAAFTRAPRAHKPTAAVPENKD